MLGTTGSLTFLRSFIHPYYGSRDCASQIYDSVNQNISSSGWKKK